MTNSYRFAVHERRLVRSFLDGSALVFRSHGFLGWPVRTRRKLPVQHGRRVDAVRAKRSEHPQVNVCLESLLVLTVEDVRSGLQVDSDVVLQDDLLGQHRHRLFKEDERACQACLADQLGRTSHVLIDADEKVDSGLI